MRPRSILITGGIGDVFALDSFMEDEERAAIRVVFYATQRHAEIQSLLEVLPNFQIASHQIVTDDWRERWCFNSKAELEDHFHINLDCADYSITPKFVEFRQKRYTYSSFLMHDLATVTHELPSDFCFIQPNTTWDRRVPDRNFDESDWEWTLKHLDYLEVPGVVVGMGDDPVPEDSRLVNLTNRTSLTESIEILKKAGGYIGIDSCFSVLASKLFAMPNLVVKTRNGHVHRNKHAYYAPWTIWPWVVPRISQVQNWQ